MTETNTNALDWLDFEWADWQSLNPSSGFLSSASTNEGLYRVRHPQYDGLVYIGETGRSTRGRIRSLARRTYDEEMPFRDPHTAAPCLWAIRDHDGPALEFSWTTPEQATEKQSRMGIEAALIALHRRDVGHSPTANFGRIIEGYRQSGYRREELVGGPLPEGETEANAELGTDPLPWTNANTVRSGSWMGLIGPIQLNLAR